MRDDAPTEQSAVAPTLLAHRYEVGPLIGSGGSADVYRGFDRLLRREVAVKCYTSRAWTTEGGRTRFEAEARLAASLHHPNVVAIFDMGVDDDVAFLVLECLPGSTLADEIAAGPLAVDRSCDVTRQLLGALGAAHAQGMVHRDVKPSNVLTTATETVKLADFGIAMSLDATQLTETGTVVGTPAYIAPERLSGEPATVSSDLYSVGVLLYAALAGDPPFHGETPVAVAYAVTHAAVRPLHRVRPEVGSELSQVVARAMAKAPRDRFTSAAEFIGAVDAAEGSTDRVAATVAVPVQVTQVMPQAEPSAPTANRVRSRRARSIAFLVVLLAVVLGALALFARSSGTEAPSSKAPTAAPTTVAPLPPALRGPFDALQHAVTP